VDRTDLSQVDPTADRTGLRALRSSPPTSGAPAADRRQVAREPDVPDAE
jgi:hypothetical protein